MLYATDAVALGDVRVNDSGYLEAFAHTARTGVQRYLGSEMGRPDLGVVNVYRDAADVFSHASLHSFEKVPVTVDHPPGGVSAANWKQVAVGTTGEEVLRDGERLKIGLKIMDAAAIEAVRSGKRELSVGYQTEIVWGDGVAPDGTPYQARQTKIVADHIAIVSAGRAGSTCRIGDSWSALGAGEPRGPGGDTQRTPQQHRDALPMKTLMIDGHSVALDDAAFIAVSAMQRQLGTAVADALAKDKDLTAAKDAHAKAITAKDEAHAAALKAKDTELATKDAEIETLKAAQIDDAKLDALATARADVIGKAKGIVADVKTDGLSISAIRRATVVAKLGDAAMQGKSDDYVEARFDLLADEAAKRPDALGRAVADSLPNQPQPGNVVQLGDAASEYARMRERDANAWKMGA